MRFGVTHREAERILLEVQDIPADRHAAVRSRLRLLQRLGLAAGARQGQGKRAIYGARDLVVMALALEFSQAGMAPERTLKLIQENDELIERAISAAAVTKTTADSIFFVFDPVALRNDTVFFTYVDAAGFRKVYEEFAIQRRLIRLSAIGLSALIDSIVDVLYPKVLFDVPGAGQLAANAAAFLRSLGSNGIRGVNDGDS